MNRTAVEHRVNYPAELFQPGDGITLLQAGYISQVSYAVALKKKEGKKFL